MDFLFLKIESLATGNQLAMKNISQTKIRSITFKLPPLIEQAGRKNC